MVVAVAKVLAVPGVVYLDEFASDGSVAASGRYVLLALLERTALGQLDAARVELWLHVRIGSDAHGLYSSPGWGMRAAEWRRGGRPRVGHVYMHGNLGAVLDALRAGIDRRRNPTLDGIGVHMRVRVGARGALARCGPRSDAQRDPASGHAVAATASVQSSRATAARALAGRELRERDAAASERRREHRRLRPAGKADCVRAEWSADGVWLARIFRAEQLLGWVAETDEEELPLTEEALLEWGAQHVWLVWKVARRQSSRTRQHADVEQPWVIVAPSAALRSVTAIGADTGLGMYRWRVFERDEVIVPYGGASIGVFEEDDEDGICAAIHALPPSMANKVVQFKRPHGKVELVDGANAEPPYASRANDSRHIRGARNTARLMADGNLVSMNAASPGTGYTRWPTVTIGGGWAMLMASEIRWAYGETYWAHHDAQVTRVVDVAAAAGSGVVSSAGAEAVPPVVPVAQRRQAVAEGRHGDGADGGDDGDAAEREGAAAGGAAEDAASGIDGATVAAPLDVASQHARSPETQRTRRSVTQHEAQQTRNSVTQHGGETLPTGRAVALDVAGAPEAAAGASVPTVTTDAPARAPGMPQVWYEGERAGMAQFLGGGGAATRSADAPVAARAVAVEAPRAKATGSGSLRAVRDPPRAPPPGDLTGTRCARKRARDPLLPTPPPPPPAGTFVMRAQVRSIVRAAKLARRAGEQSVPSAGGGDMEDGGGGEDADIGDNEAAAAGGADVPLPAPPALLPVPATAGARSDEQRPCDAVHPPEQHTAGGAAALPIDEATAATDTGAAAAASGGPWMTSAEWGSDDEAEVAAAAAEQGYAECMAYDDADDVLPVDMDDEAEVLAAAEAAGYGVHEPPVDGDGEPVAELPCVYCGRAGASSVCAALGGSGGRTCLSCALQREVGPPAATAPVVPRYTSVEAGRAVPDGGGGAEAQAAQLLPSTRQLVRQAVGSVLPAADALESVLFWNTAGLAVGNVENMRPDARATALRRYDTLAPLLAARDAPTYISLSEVTGPRSAFKSARGLRHWLHERGYGSEMVAGPCKRAAGRARTAQADGGGGGGEHVGGCVLAWRLCDTTALSHPRSDAGAVLLAGKFEYKRQPTGSPPTLVGAVYGRHRHRGKVRVVEAVSSAVYRHVGCVLAGDYNLVPDASFSAHKRAACQAEEDFKVLTGSGGVADAAQPAEIVPLGHDHAGGEYSRRSTAGARAGTATIDHAVVAGVEKGCWRLRQRWFPEVAGMPVSDHELIIIERVQRVARSDGGGVYRAPKFHVHRGWSTATREVYARELYTRSQQLWVRMRDEVRRGVRAEKDVSGAAHMAALVRISNEAAAAAESAWQDGDAHTRRRRAAHAGGGEGGLHAQVKRMHGARRKVDERAAGVDRAEADVAAACAGNSPAALRQQERARVMLQLACEREDALYHPRSRDWLGRHDEGVRMALAAAARAQGAEGAAGAAAAADGVQRRGDGAAERRAQRLAFRAAVRARLAREEAYYRRQRAVARRSEDAEVWRGLVAAADAPSAAARRDAIVAAMSKAGGGGGARGGVRGYHEGDDESAAWVEDPQAVRSGIGAIYRSIDDDNRGTGVSRERALGFLAACCADKWPELEGHDGREWTLRDACSFADYQANLRRFRGGKAVSLDRMSKEMLDAAPEDFVHAMYEAAMEIATPDAQGGRVHPAIWQRVPVLLIEKKQRSRRICKLRDIGLVSQMCKIQAGLYEPAYAAIMPRLAHNHGWTPGEAARGAAMIGSMALDHAHILQHLLIALYGDIQRFFPAMDRDFVLVSEWWYGLAKDVRDGTLALYADACMMYETEHGLADFDFEQLHMTCGFVQGCRLSTEKAKIFLSSLAEALDTAAGGGGVRFWDATHGGTSSRVTSEFCADDLVGLVTCWDGAQAFAEVLDQWATLTASRFGIDHKEMSKTTYSAVAFDAEGAPVEAAQPQGVVLKVHGEPLPRLTIDGVYPHIGDRRRLDGRQDPAVQKVVSLCMGWLARVERMFRISQREFAEITNGGLAAIVEAYAPFAPISYAAAEPVERRREQIYKRFFRGRVTSHRGDRYLPAAWAPQPRFGRVTEDVNEARMIGDGWHHLTALSAAGVHAAYFAAISDGAATRLRRCARSLLDLVCFMGGMRGCTPVHFCWDHLYDILAVDDPSQSLLATPRTLAVEVFMKNVVEQRRLMERTMEGAPAVNFYLHQAPEAGDPFDPGAPLHQHLDVDRLEVYRGSTATDEAKRIVGHARRPCWLLLAAGVVMRSHVSNDAGDAFMTYDEACAVIPRLATYTGSRRRSAERAWQRLVSDLELLDVAPVQREDVTDAYSVWHAAASAGGADGAACLGSRDELDALAARLASGDEVAADEWERAYGIWVQHRRAKPRGERAAATPAPPRPADTHIRYSMPPEPGRTQRVETTRGGAAPSVSQQDKAKLAAFAQQDWVIAPDGRSIACTRGTPLADASVIVQLMARAIAVVVPVYDEAQRVKAKVRAKQLRDAAEWERPAPPEREPTAEEKSWDGGPGYSVQRASVAMHVLLRRERMQGYTYTAAVVGDGSWDKRGRRVSRAALFHDGREVGGPVDVEDVIGGQRTNYDGEMAHRNDVLHALAGARLLYIFDSTSPIQAAEHFARCSMHARTRFDCDDWLGSAQIFEARQQSVDYYWLKSHCGHLPEAAADALAKRKLTGEPVGVPVAPYQHASLHMYAKGCERRMMLATANLCVVQQRYQLGDASMRATARDMDLLRAAKLNERDALMIRCARDDRARIMVSRAYADSGVDSLGGLLRRQQCPCGGGQQTLEHVIWHCTLPAVASIRGAQLTPAVCALCTELDKCEPVTKTHQVGDACRMALKSRRAPASTGIGAAGGQLDAAQARSAALRHVLGIVREPGDRAEAWRSAARRAGPMLRATAQMLHAAEAAVTTVVAMTARESTNRVKLRRALAHMQIWGWVQRRVGPAARVVPVATARKQKLRPQAAGRVVPIRLPPVATPSSLRHAGQVFAAALGAEEGERDERVCQVQRQLSQLVEAPVRAAQDMVVDAEVVLEVLEGGEDNASALRGARARLPMPRRQSVDLANFHSGGLTIGGATTRAPPRATRWDATAADLDDMRRDARSELRRAEARVRRAEASVVPDRERLQRLEGWLREGRKRRDKQRQATRADAAAVEREKRGAEQRGTRLTQDEKADYAAQQAKARADAQAALHALRGPPSVELAVSMSVDELRDALRARGVRTTGCKPELVERLLREYQLPRGDGHIGMPPGCGGGWLRVATIMGMTTEAARAELRARGLPEQRLVQEMKARLVEAVGYYSDSAPPAVPPAAPRVRAAGGGREEAARADAARAAAALLDFAATARVRRRDESAAAADADERRVVQRLAADATAAGDGGRQLHGAAQAAVPYAGMQNDGCEAGREGGGEAGARAARAGKRARDEPGEAHAGAKRCARDSTRLGPG